MALAPRNQGPNATHTRSKSSVASASGKARQRARNKAAGQGTHAGSSGQAKAIKDLPKRLWDEIEDEAVHLCDIAGKISHSQVGSSGYLTSTLNSPLEYAHDLLDAHVKARDGMVYIRIYHVPLSGYLGDAADADGDGDTDIFDAFNLA